MSNLHIYAAKGQPATRYVLEVDTPKGVKRLISRTPARSLLPCHKCRKRRIARRR